MRYYLIAGEASGDIHGANLIKSLRARDPEAIFRAWGGDRMHAEIGELVRHFRDTAFMGFVDVVKNLPTILRRIKECRSDITSWSPDVVLLVDYPGFNMRIAEWLHRKKIATKIIYYISPQVWAWKSSRAIKLKAIVDEMLVILPFEPSFYEKYNFRVRYVGHPLLDEIEHTPVDHDFRTRHHLNEHPIVALLPGSRKQEISSLLAIMLSLEESYPKHQFIIGGLSQISKKVYTKHFRSNSGVKLIIDETENLLQHASYAVVASGTATLLTALYKVPQVVCYRGSAINYWIAKNLIDIKFISLVNLILDRPLVTELIQADFTVLSLKNEFERLHQESNLTRIRAGYEELRSTLGGAGASDKAAKIIFSSLQARNN